MSSREQIKILIVKEALTVKKLAQMLADKISLSSLRYDEMEIIAGMLGYRITIERI